MQNGERVLYWVGICSYRDFPNDEITSGAARRYGKFSRNRSVAGGIRSSIDGMSGVNTGVLVAIQLHDQSTLWFCAASLAATEAETVTLRVRLAAVARFVIERAEQTVRMHRMQAESLQLSRRLVSSNHASSFALFACHKVIDDINGALKSLTSSRCKNPMRLSDLMKRTSQIFAAYLRGADVSCCECILASEAGDAASYVPPSSLSAVTARANVKIRKARWVMKTKVHLSKNSAAVTSSLRLTNTLRRLQAAIARGNTDLSGAKSSKSAAAAASASLLHRTQSTAVRLAASSFEALLLSVTSGSLVYTIDTFPAAAEREEGKESNYGNSSTSVSYVPIPLSVSGSEWRVGAHGLGGSVAHLCMAMQACAEFPIGSVLLPVDIWGGGGGSDGREVDDAEGFDLLGGNDGDDNDDDNDDDSDDDSTFGGADFDAPYDEVGEIFSAPIKTQRRFVFLLRPRHKQVAVSDASDTFFDHDAPMEEKSTNGQEEAFFTPEESHVWVQVQSVLAKLFSSYQSAASVFLEKRNNDIANVLKKSRFVQVAKAFTAMREGLIHKKMEAIARYCCVVLYHAAPSR